MHRAHRWSSCPRCAGCRSPFARFSAVLAAALIALAAAAGAAGAAAVPAGTALSFGDNYFGQLGSSTNNGMSTASNPMPTAVTLPGTVLELAAGSNHSLVLTTAGLYAFGYNADGELGNSTNNGNGNPNPTPALVTLPGASGPATHVAAGDSQSLALTSTGQVYAFGGNGSGQLGRTANSTPNPTPALVTLPGASGPGTQIAAGFVHSLVVTSTGQLYAFGDNEFGQLGNSTNNNTSNPNPTPALVTLPGASGPVTQAAAGRFFSLALTSTGQLYAFGKNDGGQLGNATHAGSPTPNPVPALVTLPPSATGPIVRIAAGDADSFAVTATGQLYAFGINKFGQLGIATNSGTYNANFTPALVTLPGATGPVSQVAGAGQHSLAVTSTGQLYAFGDNNYGQLGNSTNTGSDTTNPTPTLVALPAGTTIDAVAKGSEASFSLALVGDLGIASSALPPAQVGAHYQVTLTSSGGTGPMAWSVAGLPGGLTINSATGTISGTPTAAGTFAPAVTLTDVYGSATAKTESLAVAAAPSSTPPAPTLSAFHESATTWLEGNGPAQLSARRRKPPVGTTFSFGLDQAASVTLTFNQKVAGRKVGKRCVAQTKRTLRKPRCSRIVSAGTLRLRAHPGTNNVRFQGRVSASKKLKPGRYTVVVVATNSTGRSSTASSLGFTIVKR